MTPTCPLCAKPDCKHWRHLGRLADTTPYANWHSEPSLIVDEAENEAEIVRAGLAYRAWRKLYRPEAGT